MVLRKVTPPEKLQSCHSVKAFDSGKPVLDEWLQKRALRNDETGASRTYVVCIKKQVVGFYTLAVGSIEARKAPGKIRQNMPDPIPVMIIGRLAVDQKYQRSGIGRGLLRDAILRIVQAAEIAGIRAILVHALDDGAKTFYQRCGFRASPLEPLTLLITVADAINEG
ncbi:MAG: GNAT family N-acetyltransferase [Nitrospinae bacterium CG22_combo_CG10-13_8_21_14_all_47_10]|nr:MAG: GNAT family N-acetyltransferase [Nitrospinae bacterium CG22_combo_CG10-13_8_21_14_all_47_10]